jgi:group I intron endonuclease
MDIIYKITSPKGKSYIGRTNDFKRRMVEHKHCAYSKKSSNSLYRAIRKYGWDNMNKEIICEVDSTQSQKIEEEFISLNNTVRKGYNDSFIGTGGDVWIGRRDTTEYMEFVEKMKEINKGEKNGMYGKPRSGDLNPMFGKKHSEEARKKMSEKAKLRFKK